MSFISQFHSIQFELTNSDSGAYISSRLKVPRHEDESPEHFIRRLIAFSNSYQSGLRFSAYPHGELASDLIAHDDLGCVSGWISIGPPKASSLRRMLNMYPTPKLSVYFETREEIAQFCHQLRGATENWAQQVRFLLTPADVATAIAGVLSSSFRWSATIIDGAFFLSALGKEWSFAIEDLDIWREFQQSIQNASADVND